MKLNKMTRKLGGGELSFSLRAAALYFAAAAFPFAANADITTNYWQGSDGAAWGTPGNWSENHVPTIDEYVIFPDKGASYSINVDGDYGAGCFYVDYRNEGASGVATLTLTGSGRITGGDIGATHFVRTNRKLVLESGVTLDLGTDRRDMRIYNGFVIKAGATNIVKTLYLHWSGSYVALEGGYLGVNGTTAYRNANSIRVEDGSYYSSGVVCPASDASSSVALDLEINGGLASCRSVTISENSTFTMNGGTFRFRALPTIAAGTTLNFNGGTNEFTVAVTDGAIARRFLCGNEKTAIHVTTTSDSSLLIDESCTVTAPLRVDGGIYFTNKVTVAGRHTLFVNTFYNTATASGNAATIRFPAIVFGGSFPFKTTKNTRQFFVEGPATFGTTADCTSRPGAAPYPFVTGDIIIDTHDWNDSSVVHSRTFELGPYEDASITIRSNSVVTLAQQCSGSPIPYRSVVVEEDATLSLIIEGSTDGRFHTDRFVLGPRATLNLDMKKAGTAIEFNAVIAGKWDIDPTAAINVTLPPASQFATTNAIAILLDEGSDSLADYSSQITYLGDTEGVTFVRSGGSLVAVRKTVTEADGTYPTEWTGRGSTGNWSDGANWYDGGIPSTESNCVFGACDAKTTSVFDLSGNGANRIIFRDTAVASFTISPASGSYITYRDTSYGARSYSVLPQFVGVRARSTGNLSLSAYRDGPIVFSGGFTSKSENKVLTITGDIRCHNSGLAANIQWPVLAFADPKATRLASRFSVMDGSMTITNQTTGIGASSASLRVAAGATLTFKNGTSSSIYRWTKTPQRIVVDGTLDIQAPFVGGENQIYGGDGTLKIASLRPSNAATSVGFTDSLSVTVPAMWPTVASTGADTPLTVAARAGRPVIHAANGWTYGPDAGTSTSTLPSDRAARVYGGATLAVEPGGGIATFNDPVTGPGTLEITNGTLRIAGGISAETHVAVAADAAFDLGASDASLAGIDVADGGTLIFSGGVFTVSGDVSMSGANLQVSDGVMGSGPGWKRLLVANSISGVPSLPGPNWESRTLALENGSVAFEVRIVHGSCLILR